jgi:hypothetical protein
LTLADQWILVTRGAQLPLDDPADEITSGSVFLDSRTWEDAAQLQSNAFCGGIGHTTTKNLVMVGGHGRVRCASIVYIETCAVAHKLYLSMCILRQYLSSRP